MPSKLVVVAGPDKGKVFALQPKGTMVVGRGRTSQTQLADPHVSRAHCEICCEGTRVLAKDAQSAAGTYVNNERITEHALRHGDVIRIGETELRFESEVADDSTLPPPDGPPGPAPRATPVSAPAVPKATTTPAATVPATPAAKAPAPAKDIVFANRAGGRVLPKPLKDLEALTGKALGNYQLMRVLGAGTIGLVFQARDLKDQKSVALKVLTAEFSRDAKAVLRFIRGMKAARSLSHPNLVAIHSAGVAKPHCWVAMELVEGASLADELRAQAGKFMDWKQCVNVTVQLARGLGYIHERGMIHRNVLPQNVMIRLKDWTAKLGDVTLAKALEGSASQDLSASGELVGNIYYMAPERTQSSVEPDGRADIYSLGATLYQMLTGRLLFQGGSLIELAQKIRQALPDRPSKYQPAVPAALDAMVLRMLAKNPAERFATAADLVKELERLQQAARS